MDNFKIYTFDQIALEKLNLDKLAQEIQDSEISATFIRIKVSNSDFIVVFSSNLSSSDIEVLDALVLNHDALSAQEKAEASIKNAIAFFNSLLVKFSAENTINGIVNEQKCKVVADYLKDAILYGQVGSLYQVIIEIDALILAGVPAELSPYVTSEKLNFLKQSIETYLGV